MLSNGLYQLDTVELFFIFEKWKPHNLGLIWYAIVENVRQTTNYWDIWGIAEVIQIGCYKIAGEVQRE